MKGKQKGLSLIQGKGRKLDVAKKREEPEAVGAPGTDVGVGTPGRTHQVAVSEREALRSRTGKTSPPNCYRTSWSA